MYAGLGSRFLKHKAQTDDVKDVEYIRQLENLGGSKFYHTFTHLVTQVNSRERKICKTLG